VVNIKIRVFLDVPLSSTVDKYSVLKEPPTPSSGWKNEMKMDAGSSSKTLVQV
jgi:hypothetical protein